VLLLEKERGDEMRVTCRQRESIGKAKQFSRYEELDWTRGSR
jgi:hypothetical protein